MKVLLAGEDREGALLRSLEHGLRTACELTVVDPARRVTQLIDNRSQAARIRRRLARRDIDACFLEAVRQLSPDICLIVKGRGIRPEVIEAARSVSKVAIYYPDNPFWGFADTADTLQRLSAADLTLTWSHRICGILQSKCRRVEVVPFGYDERWFPLTEPGCARSGVTFVGTWHPRRERYLRALADLPLTVVGTGWPRIEGIGTSPPQYGSSAGAILGRSAIAVNIFHPHNAGAHNMRTREIAASGALQITDPGNDGTPLRDDEGCRWFRSPMHLRELVEYYLTNREEGVSVARHAQELAGADTYSLRAEQMLQLFGSMK